MTNDQNKSKSLIFSQSKSILKMHESLLITYYCCSTLIIVHLVIPGSLIKKNKELKPKP